MNTVMTTGLISTLVALVAGSAFAQSPMTPLSSADRQYLTQSAQGSVADEATGELGVQSAQDNAVQQYAIRVVEDHARLNMQLLILAHNRGVTLPVIMADKDRNDLMNLMQKSGADFDRDFLQQEVRTNSDDVRDAKQELTTTTDPQVRDIIQQYLNTEQVHLDQARMLLEHTR